MGPSVTFRFARPEELPDAARLAAHSFPHPARTPAWWLEQLRDPPYGGGAGTLWVGEADGRVVAACQLHPLRQWLAGRLLPVMGLGTVAIAPTHRKQGLAARLVSSALQEARGRGDLASALYPFRASFYARLGYGMAGEAQQFLIPPDALPDAPERLRVELADGDAVRAEVRALYDQWAAGQTGQVERPERVWQEMYAAPNRALVAYRSPEGRVEGYAQVWYRVDLPPTERFLEVEELAWTSTPARRGLYAWLGSLGDQWRQLLLRSLPSHRLADWLGELRLPAAPAPGWGLWFPTAALLTGPMFRLLDLPGAWAQRPVAPDASVEAVLEVEDEQLEENRGAWRLQLAGGRATLERGAGGGGAIRLRLGISTLSRLFIGALSPSNALAAGLATSDGPPERLAELERALRLPEPWTFDRF